MFPALGVHRLLTQKRLAFCELSEKLIVKVVAVSQYYDGRTVQRLLQKMGIENHRQRLAAALGMPEYAAFAVRFGGVSRGFHGFSDGEILMISREYLELFQALAGKADEILDNIKQTLPFKDTFKEGVELCVLRIFIIAVLCFPLHETVFAGGDRSGF